MKLFATDLDGTFLNERHQIDDFLINTIDQIIASGNIFAVCTGRDMHVQKHSILDFRGRQIYTICDNGALVFDQNRKVLFQRCMDSSFVKDALTTFPNLFFDCIDINKKYSTHDKESVIHSLFTDSLFKKLFSPEQVERGMSDYEFDQTIEQIVSKDILKMNARVNVQEEREFLQFLKGYEDRIVNAPFQDHFLELTEKTVNKALGVQKLADHLNIDQEDIFVYGDSGNDIEMLKEFENAFVPSNGSQQAKRYAKEILGDVSTYAVAKHMMENI